MKIYQIDAFTNEVFKGNPAAVVPLEKWLPTETMQQIAAENNLAETAFFVQEENDNAAIMATSIIGWRFICYKK